MRVEMEMSKDLRKKVEKYQSVLKAFRAQGGWSLGIFALGIILIVCGVIFGGLLMMLRPIGGLIVGAVFIVPGLLAAALGRSSNKKRVNSYLDFFHKEAGYSAEELQEADRELMGSDAVAVTCPSDRVKKETLFIITEHYFLSAWPVQGCYLRKLDDIVAAFYSNQIPGINGYRRNLFIITRQDIQQDGVKNEYTGKQYRGFENSLLTNQSDCQQVCMAVLDEMAKRAPHIITSQNISVKGVRYNLLSMDNWRADWARIFEG